MNKKQLFINIIAQIISFISAMGINFFLSPFIVSNIGVASYGFIGLANDFVGYAALFTLALNSMAARFITIEIQQKNMEKANQYFTSILVANIAISVLLIIPVVAMISYLDRFLDVSKDISMDVKLLWSLVFINFFISIIMSIYNVAIFAKNRLELSSIISIESSLIRCGILILLFYIFTPNIWYVGIAAIASTGFIAYRNMIYTKKLLPEIYFSTNFFKIRRLKEVFMSGIWNLITRLSQIIFKDTNLLLANLLIDATSMGIIAIIRIIPRTILSIFAMMSAAFAPQLTISYANGSFSDIKEQLFLSIKIFGVFSAIPLCVVWTIGDVFFLLWMPLEDYRIFYMLTSIACAELTFLLALECLWNVFTATNRLKIPSIYLILESIAIISITIFTMQFVFSAIDKLIVIVTVGSIISIIRSLTIFPIYGALCLGFKWNMFYPLIAKNACVLFILTGFFLYVKTIIVIATWMHLLLYIMLIIVVALIVSYYFLLDNNDRHRVVQVICRKIFVKFIK